MKTKFTKTDKVVLVIFFTILILGFILCFLMFSRVRWYHGKRPIDQPGSTWISEDSTITLIVSNEYLGPDYLIIKVEDEMVTFEFTIGPSTQLIAYPIDAAEDGGISSDEIYEVWDGNYIFSDRFTATVEKTTYFEVGQKIKFYRVDE